MNWKAKIVTICFLVIPTFLLGCSTGNGSEDPVQVDELTITYEPESCVYDGPKVIQSGEIKVVFNNLSENTVIYGIFLLTEGKSWQDIVDNFREKNRNVGMPDWAILQSGKLNIKDTRVKVYNLEPGSYALACSEILPTGGFIDWIASPLEVK